MMMNGHFFLLLLPVIRSRVSDVHDDDEGRRLFSTRLGGGCFVDGFSSSFLVVVISAKCSHSSTIHPFVLHLLFLSLSLLKEHVYIRIREEEKEISRLSLPDRILSFCTYGEKCASACVAKRILQNGPPFFSSNLF